MEVVSLISFLAIIVCLVFTIVSAIKKSGKVKKWGLGILASFIIFIVSIIAMPSDNIPSSSNADSTKATETVSQTVTSSDITSQTDSSSNIASSESTQLSLVEYITQAQFDSLTDNMAYKDFVSLIGGEGELVYDRDGVKTYLFYLKDTENEIRIAFDNDKLFEKTNSADFEDSEEQTNETIDTTIYAAVSDNVTKISISVDGIDHAGYRSNGMEFVIINVIKSDKIGEETASGGVFWIATLGVANIQKESVTIDAMDFALVDAQGNEYESSSDASFELALTEEKVFNYEQINPKMNYLGMIPFKVPRNIESFSLKYSGGLFEEDIVIPFQVEILK